MKSIGRLIFILLFILMFLQADIGLSGGKGKSDVSTAKKKEVQNEKTKLPWAFGGFKNQEQFHLRYFYIFREAVEKAGFENQDWEDSIRENSGIVEIWFKRDGSLFRLDRYLEKLESPCESYEGKEPEPLTYEGKIYRLYERIIQKGLQKTEYKLTSQTKTTYDPDKTKNKTEKVCKFEKNSWKEIIELDQEGALGFMTRGETVQPVFWFYFSSSPMSKELETSGLELTKLMKPLKYKKITEGWKKKEEIAGRATVRNYDAAPIFGGGEGFQLIDTELGIGLSGYLEEFRNLDTGKKAKFEKPKLIYIALILETTFSDDVFEIN